jgi:hypothetical protein
VDHNLYGIAVRPPTGPASQATGTCRTRWNAAEAGIGLDCNVFAEIQVLRAEVI